MHLHPAGPFSAAGAAADPRGSGGGGGGGGIFPSVDTATATPPHGSGAPSPALLREARTLAALSEVEAAAIEVDLKAAAHHSFSPPTTTFSSFPACPSPPLARLVATCDADLETSVADRMPAAVAAAAMTPRELCFHLREEERRYAALRGGGGDGGGAAAAASARALIARLSTLRTRRDQLGCSVETEAASLRRGFGPPAASSADSPAAVSATRLAPGDLAETAVLSGRWAGCYVDCTVHRRQEGGRLFTVHVLPTARYDHAVGHSGRLVRDVSFRHIRVKEGPRVVAGGRYEGVDEGGVWWPVTATGENTDGTYAVAVHDGTPTSPPTVWPRVFASNLREARDCGEEAAAAAAAAASDFAPHGIGAEEHDGGGALWHPGPEHYFAPS